MTPNALLSRFLIMCTLLPLLACGAERTLPDETVRANVDPARFLIWMGRNPPNELATVPVAALNAPVRPPSVGIHIQFGFDAATAADAVALRARLRQDLATPTVPFQPKNPGGGVADTTVARWLRACRGMLASDVPALPANARFLVDAEVDWTPDQGASYEVVVDCDLIMTNPTAADLNTRLTRARFLEIFGEPGEGTPLHTYISIVEN